MNGFRQVFNESVLANIRGYTTSTKKALCSNIDLTTSLTEHGISIEQVKNGFILSTQFKAYQDNGKCDIDSSYLDVDGMLINIDTLGKPIWCNRVARFTGINFNTPVKVGKNGEYYLLGSHLDSINRTISLSLINVKTDGMTGWRKDYLADKGGAKYQLPFSLVLTSDGGFAVGGSNDLNNKDFSIIKFRSECQNNLTTLGDDIINGRTITSDETWSTNRKVKGKVIVKAGKTLTIQNCTVQFLSSLETNDYQKLASNDSTAIETKIIVEPEGHLVINKAILRGCNSCGKDWMWEGIEVWGVPNQSSDKQGTIEMSNSQIKDAILGLSLGSKFFNENGNANPTFSKGGGVALVKNNSSFTNCRKSVWFAPHIYQNKDNGSQFDHVRFETTSAMVDENYIDIYEQWNENYVPHRLGVNEYVSMVGVKGIVFNDCVWSNDFGALGLTNPNKYSGIGIKSVDANAYITSTDDPNLRVEPHFSNLEQGIHAQFSDSTMKSYSITGNLFKNVLSNIWVNGGTNLFIDKNVFTDIPSFEGGYGVVMLLNEKKSNV